MDSFVGAGCVVTGGASGIGYSVAQHLAKRGTHLVIADLESADLEAAVTALRSEGVTVTGFTCDVRFPDQVDALADFAFGTLDHVDILFNNAGVGVSGPVQTTTLSDWKWVIDVDLWGPIHGVHSFLPRMVEQGRQGHILFTASYAGLAPVAGMGPYCVAKYGVVALAEVLRSELREHNIGVSILCPMRVATNFGKSGRSSRDPGRSAADANAALVKAVPALAKGSAVAGRVLSPDEIATAAIGAMEKNQLYVLPHDESREFIKRRFDRIDHTFEST
jgi:NAD(P)-dependent dehydrogenase (short-subunit alcohol dehydrogenase family)